LPGPVEHEGQNEPVGAVHDSPNNLQTPDDLVGRLVFLCSADNDFMTGQAIVVDGRSVYH
jgi:NAD(P)-dependent dehydrogenase (short-subunit alcohol dehydrogenase family)